MTPTDATKLPEHIHCTVQGCYASYTDLGAAVISPADWTSDDLRAIAAHMDAQAGRTAALVVTEEMIDTALAAHDRELERQHPGHDADLDTHSREAWRAALTAALAKQPRDATSGEGT